MRRQNRVEILGIGVDSVNMVEAIAIIEEFIANGKPSIVVTADASGIVAAQTDEHWRKIMEDADLVTPDSVGVLWAAGKVGSPLEERVSGVDIVEKLAELSAKKGYRLYFLGAAPGVAQAAANALSSRFPGTVIGGVQDGYFSAAEVPEIVARIREVKPDVLFVAMGIPKQEMFITEHMNEIAAKVSIGVGGSFDVFSGNVKRAPKFVQNLRMEWLWRLIQNPRKWRKVATLPKFWWLVMRSGRRA